MRKPQPSVTAAAAVVAAAIAAAAACHKPPTVLPTETARAALVERVGPAGGDGPVYCRRDRICGSDVLPGFYRARGFRPAWIDDGLGLREARVYLAALRLVAQDGLDPANYHLAALETLLAEIGAEAKRGPRHVRAEALADLEMLLTDSFLLCGSHLVKGQVDPETIRSDWSIKGRIEDLAAALERGLAARDLPGALDSLRPGHAVYRGLRRAYDEYRARVAAGGWPVLSPGPKLVKGDWDPRVRALRETLAAMGEMTAPGDGGKNEPELFDGALEAAVKSFQRRHGLEPDGVIGAGTASALGVSAGERLAQIRANLERWRWITQDLGEKYVLVNVADYRVGVYEAGRAVLSMPAIVGRAYRQTPDFSSRMSTITLNPAWHVPPKLAREDILPNVRKNPSYLAKKRFRVFADWSAGARELDPATIDWKQVDADRLSFKFRQDPGAGNSLGRMVFQFPNKFDVYIHDTPEHGLFIRAVRDFSSGCIRVQRPLDLALYMLRDEPDWTKEKLQKAIDAGETKVIRVRTPLSVHVLYWTAWLGGDGRVQFRQDIYLRDAALVRALDERAVGSAR
jgi:murein L,D-transpeptidase YcbB/YkuD